MMMSQRILALAQVIAADIAALEQRNTSAGNTSNVIVVDTVIAADTSYIVLGNLDVSAALTINGNVGVI